MDELPFSISIQENEPMGAWDLQILVGGLESRAKAERVAELIKDWLIEDGEGGWAAKVQ